MEKDYICGCGKAYGSYPAFSTHRKQKHNNETIQGTIIPSQEKAKRGRPSCDFKKIPQMYQSKRQFLQGLNVIELGLLDLEQKYKGKILNIPEENNQNSLDDLDSQDDEQRTRIRAISTFTQLITDHMKKQTSQFVVGFIRNMVQYGIQTSQLLSIQLYNTYCLQNIKQLKNSKMGMDFFVNICLMLSKWLCVMGYSTQILKLKARTASVDSQAITG